MRIGIDWGGTKIEAIALSDAGAVLACKRITTPQHDYEACIAAASGLVREIEMALGQTERSASAPGSPATGLVKNANSVWLNGRPLDKDMEQASAGPCGLRTMPIAWPSPKPWTGPELERWSGRSSWARARAPASPCMAEPLLGGIGCEWGHNPLPWPRDDERPGPACYCGRQGCLETFVSGTGIAAGHRRRSGQALSAEAIVRAMRAGEPDARRTYDLFLDRLARGLAHVVNILEPDVIVLGGGLSPVDEIYADVPSDAAIRLLGRVQYTGA